MGEVGAAAIGSIMTAVLAGLGILIVRLYKARGGYANDIAGAEVMTSAEDHRQQTENASAEQKRESIVVKELKELVESLKTERAEDRKQIHDLRNQMNKIAIGLALCKAGRARADERIASLEEALDGAKIPHRRWTPDAEHEGSGSYDPLPPTVEGQES